MAKKTYVSNKEKRQNDANEKSNKTVYKSPNKTLTGRIVIIILAAAMIILPIATLIYTLVN